MGDKWETGYHTCPNKFHKLKTSGRCKNVRIRPAQWDTKGRFRVDVGVGTRSETVVVDHMSGSSVCETAPNALGERWDHGGETRGP